MGGKALKKAKTRRYNKKEFDDMVDELLPKVKKSFETEVELVIAYEEKDSFGDMDILFMRREGFPDIDSVLRRDFSATEIHHNGDCISFDYKELQIDLIFTKPENWEIAQIFFSYNDLGNLMGKLYHKFGLKYGFDGVKYIYRIDNDKKLGEVSVSKDPEKIFRFLGLNWNQYQKGFKDMKEVFDFVIDGPYFDPNVFQMKNLNAIDRQRNKKRVNYGLFLKYIEEHEFEAKTKWERGEDKSKYHSMIHEFFFPGCNFNSELKKLRKKEKERKEIAKKFNGKLVMEWFPKLVGKELGTTISRFKEYIKWSHKGYLPLTFEGWVKMESAQNIKLRFHDYVERINNEKGSAV